MFHVSENYLSHHICKTLIFCLIFHTASHYYAEKQTILIPSGNHCVWTLAFIRLYNIAHYWIRNELQYLWAFKQYPFYFLPPRTSALVLLIIGNILPYLDSDTEKYPMNFTLK